MLFVKKYIEVNWIMVFFPFKQSIRILNFKPVIFLENWIIFQAIGLKESVLKKVFT